ncbi:MULTISPECIES: ABC transporter substrate-binding protein [Pseudomonas]|uniref:LacI family transcriptional regulator n=1 Tax=Pseudomonas plecoglossicida TaxID=70775 RepID=A0ABX4U4Z9_PSEDL|nr:MULTISPECIES: ABC transporter substrate-binding protein [Pseudomonas]TXI02622.1 MAG: LacI family transcriptional regulator [Pseudomonas monteilii]PLU86403.1 LacI family transcriptional regulator [Pseudomonas plecoglossicida]PLU94156.1 LacI family transcriptional regulator [Pseudomonas plecoglossicida]PLV04997.1 LacI family transcriptional regulator [Pseudomonas plecoglossicida]PLV14183.1 LacI family transcriptional regulator [Pseudomonas plecoglossicida]
MLKALCQSLCLALPLAASAQPASVVFLNPGLSTETFWTSYTRFMQAAADDLGMTLHVEYSERRADLALTQARAILGGPQRPDYLVLVNERYVAPEIIRLSRGTGVKLFLVNNGLTASQARSIEAQPDKYAELLGTLTANDEQAGFEMLHQMVAQLPRDSGPVDLLAFAGVKTTPASQLREEGMRRALADFPQVRLRQVVYGGWSRQRAYEQAQQLVERYPATRLVWSANDEMAFGAMQAFEEAGRKPGRDVLFSAINSSPEALHARIDGRLSVLMGGHFTLGGWAMVMLHDDAQGLAVNRDGLREHRIPVLQSIDQAKATRWLKLLERPDYGIDFQHYSAEGRPPDYQYPFLTSPINY